MSDLISREQALNAVKWDTEAYTAINMLPSIDAVKHGRWIKMSDADGQYYCRSECGEELYRKLTFDREFDIFPHKKSIEKTMYCPNCGARMDGEENG